MHFLQVLSDLLHGARHTVLDWAPEVISLVPGLLPSLPLGGGCGHTGPIFCLEAPCLSISGGLYPHLRLAPNGVVVGALFTNVDVPHRHNPDPPLAPQVNRPPRFAIKALGAGMFCIRRCTPRAGSSASPQRPCPLGSDVNGLELRRLGLAEEASSEHLLLSQRPTDVHGIHRVLCSELCNTPRLLAFPLITRCFVVCSRVECALFSKTRFSLYRPPRRCKHHPPLGHPACVRQSRRQEGGQSWQGLPHDGA